MIEQNAWKQASVEFAATNVDQRPEIHELEHALEDLPERSLSGTDRLLLFDLVLAWNSKPIPRVVGTTPNALVQDDPLSSVLVFKPTPIPLVPSAGEHFTYRPERRTSLDHTPWFDLGPFVRRCGSGSLDPEAVEPLSATHLFDRCFIASRDLPSGTYRITIPYRQGERQGLLQTSFEFRSRPEIRPQRARRASRSGHQPRARVGRRVVATSGRRQPNAVSASRPQTPSTGRAPVGGRRPPRGS